MPRMWPCERLSTIDSTQREVLRRLSRPGAQSGVPFGLWTTAQTQGIASHGRRWVDSPDGLACSLGWPETLCPLGIESAWPVRLSLITIQVLEHCFPGVRGRIGVKWPNDMMVGDKKLGGVLVSRHHVNGAWWLVAGIGVNLAWPTVPELDRPVTALIDLGVRDLMPENIVAGLSTAIAQVCSVSAQTTYVDGLTEEFRRRDIYADQSVVVVHPVSGEALARGINRGCSANGSLQLEVDGMVRSISVGELSLRPAPIVPLESR